MSATRTTMSPTSCVYQSEVQRPVSHSCATSPVTSRSASSRTGHTGQRAVADVADTAYDIGPWKVSVVAINCQKLLR